MRVEAGEAVGDALELAAPEPPGAALEQRRERLGHVLAQSSRRRCPGRHVGAHHGDDVTVVVHDRDAAAEPDAGLVDQQGVHVGQYSGERLGQLLVGEHLVADARSGRSSFVAVDDEHEAALAARIGREDSRRGRPCARTRCRTSWISPYSGRTSSTGARQKGVLADVDLPRSLASRLDRHLALAFEAAPARAEKRRSWPGSNCLPRQRLSSATDSL